jgi:hypothetical protein
VASTLAARLQRPPKFQTGDIRETSGSIELEGAFDGRVSLVERTRPKNPLTVRECTHAIAGPGYAWQDLPEDSARASDRIVAEDLMATNKDAQNKKDKAAKRKASAASKETRRERKAEKLAKREAAQKEKAESGKPMHLCSLATVEVR